LSMCRTFENSALKIRINAYIFKLGRASDEIFEKGSDGWI